MFSDRLSTWTRILVLWAAAFLTSSSLLGCSVKEDRDGCPCVLLLELDSLAGRVPEGVGIALSGESGYGFARNFPGDSLPLQLRLSVPREPLCLDVYYPPLASFGGDAGLSIEAGEACPEIWMYSALVEAEGESVGRRVVLHKNFCRLEVSITGAVGEESPFMFSVQGNVCGYRPGGALLEGLFRVTASPDVNGCFSVAIPRQKDLSLMLEVVSGNEVVRSFALGEMIGESGYDWAAPDLGDISVGIDYSRSRISLGCDMWTRIFSFEVCI